MSIIRHIVKIVAIMLILSIVLLILVLYRFDEGTRRFRYDLLCKTPSRVHLSGQVVDLRSRQPISGATVVIRNLDHEESPCPEQNIFEIQMVTGENGFFRHGGTAHTSQNFEIIISATGCDTLQRNWLTFAFFENEPPTIPLECD